MHFFYIDEAWCTLRDLDNPEQPIFVVWWLVLRDEWWNKTKDEFEKIIDKYFSWNIPNNFELHAKDLFSPNWDWFFQSHTREQRTNLINDLLDLIKIRKHHVFYHAIDKKKLKLYDTSSLRINHFDHKTPYCVSYNYIITLVNNHVKTKLWRSARWLIVIDEKDSLKSEIKEITEFRRYKNLKKDLVKWITEFSYSVDSKRNVMIQLSDFLVFIIKKFLEIDNWYRNTYSSDIKNIYKNFYLKIDERLISKKIFLEEWRPNELYNNFLSTISSTPSTRWKSKTF